MDLKEYQAKELFREVGIPVLPSQTINDPRQIKQLQIPYPVVLKSQVSSGGRGKAGGVRFVANTIDAIAAARAIFKLSILGEYPEVILAEAHYNVEKEFFLAVVLDYKLKCPVLLGSAYGGMNVESLLANLQQVAIKQEFSLFYARQLTVKMGLSGKLIQSVSQIIAKMYRLFQEQDLDLIEINPLGVNNKDELMALDGKIKINHQALARNPAIVAFGIAASLERQAQTEHPGSIEVKWLDWQEAKGNIAIICNSFDLALLTWDLVSQKKGKPACGVVITNNLVSEPTATTDYGEKLHQTLMRLREIQKLKVVLINIWESETISRQIIETIVHNAQLSSESAAKVNERDCSSSNSISLESDSSTSNRHQSDNTTSQLFSVKFVLRLVDKSQPLHPELAETIYLTSSLEEAVDRTMGLVKSR